jgi:hypothetical protein
MTRKDVLARYRHLRAIAMRHNSAALGFVSRQAVLETAKRLGLAEEGRMLVAGSQEEMTLVFDLNLHAAKETRSRALDRYARATPLPPGSDEMRMLDAMRHARFSIWRVERRHETAGLVIRDVLREAEEWLIDEKLEASAPENMAFAGRVCEPDSFAMTCGVIVPVTHDLIEGVTLDTLAWRRSDPGQVAQDPRFATAIYRAALDSGIMDHVAYE